MERAIFVSLEYDFSALFGPAKQAFSFRYSKSIAVKQITITNNGIFDNM